jgi:hypothetical protein
MTKDQPSSEPATSDIVFQPPFPMLRSRWNDGYLHLANEERHFTRIALGRHADFVEVWYRLFDLYDAAALSTHADPRPIQGTLSQLLRLQFMAVGAGTAKIILDLTLAGHYAQARALVRHLFESLVRIWYVDKLPDEAARWYMGEDGSDPRPAKNSTMVAALRNGAPALQRTLLEMVTKTIKDMDLGSHPSPQTALQTVVVGSVAAKIGGTYEADMCLDTLHHGASGLRLLVSEWPKLVSQSKEWHKELQLIIAKHKLITETFRTREPDVESA